MCLSRGMEMIVMSEVNRKAEGDYQLQILATNLRNIREKRRLSQEDVEELTGVSVNEISKIERKLTKPRLDVLAALAKGLEVDIRQLLDPCLDPAAASFCPDGNLMEQVGSALTGLPQEEQRYLVRLLVWQAAHCRNDHPEKS